MATVKDSPRKRLLAHLRDCVERGNPAPWHHLDALLAGIPRSGSTGRWYVGTTPWVLWMEAVQSGYQSAIWYTRASARRAGGTLAEDAPAVQISSAGVVNADQCGLDPHRAPDNGHGAARVADLTRFMQVPLRSGRNPDYNLSTGVIYMPAEEDFESPADYAHTMLVMLVAWTRDEQRIDRDDDSIESVVCHLGGAMLAAILRVPGTPRHTPDWTAALLDDGEGLFEAIAAAELAVRYLLNLAHPALRTEVRQLDDTPDPPRPDNAGHAIELVTSLGQALVVTEDALRDDDDDDEERQEPLLLDDGTGNTLHGFLRHFAHEEPGGRKNPPLCAWLAGGPGTGRNQVLSALNALFRTGGTDLTATALATEGGADLLAAIEQIWADDRLTVLPCLLPPRVRVSHDRAIPTAALTALHIHFGLSPHLWVARLEHRLLRSGEYGPFLAKFEEKTGRPWRGVGHRNPDANLEAMIYALGGADAGARRRVSHYKRTRTTASWRAMTDEAEWMLFHMTPGAVEPRPKAFDDAVERRALFVVDLASATESDDPAARGWLRRALSGIPSRMEEMALPEHRPTWFVLTPNFSNQELLDLTGWKSQVKRKQVLLDLEGSPVTTAIGGELLAKDPTACGPIYRLYARDAHSFHWLSTLDGFPIPEVRGRNTVLESFPFLSPVLPVAQAILDTFAGDPECLPLTTLVRKAIDEQYYAPPDRFVSLDVLLEPIAHLLEDASPGAATAATARIFVGAPVAMPARRAAFPPDTVLQTLRWANRVRGLPCTPNNLVRLMFMRLDRPTAEMVQEVTDTMKDLEERKCVRSVDATQQYQWVRSL